MVLLGLLLMLGCAALAVDAVVQNTGMMHAIAFNQSISHLSLGAIFVAGAVVGLLFALGMAMFAGGLGRASRARRERRAIERDSAAQTEALRADKERLERELDAHRTSANDAYPTDPATADTTATDTTGRSRISS
jgi:uncharacterized integral membrane protein